MLGQCHTDATHLLMISLDLSLSLIVFVVVFLFVFARGLDEKKYIVLIPLPSLIKKFVRSFVLSLSLSLS